MHFTREEAIKNLSSKGIDCREINKIIAENFYFSTPSEKVLWIECIAPQIANWYDNTIDFFAMRNSIFGDDDLDDAEEDRNSISRQSWNHMRTIFNINVVREVLRKLPKRPIRIYTPTVSSLEAALQELGVWDEYQKKHKEREEGRRLIEAAEVEVCFKNYTSWETGLRFYILADTVEPNIFSILKRHGLWRHAYDEENEERFTGWCFSGDIEKIQIALAKEGIRLVTRS